LVENSLHPVLSPNRLNKSKAFENPFSIGSGNSGLCESPLSCAIRTGNFQAACLQLTRGDAKSNYEFKITAPDVLRILNFAKKFAEMKDPLYVTAQEKNEAYSALVWLLLSEFMSPFFSPGMTMIIASATSIATA